MTQKIPLTEAIEQADYWSVGQDRGTYRAVLQPVNARDDEAEDCRVVNYTSAELRAFDARLYLALRFLIRKTISGAIPRCLQLTLAVWASPSRVVDGIGYIGAITKIQEPARTGAITCVCEWARLAKETSGIDVVVLHDTREIDIPDQWMEHHYPGCLHRIIVAQSLGLSSTDVAKAACTLPDLIVSASLPDDVVAHVMLA